MIQPDYPLADDAVIVDRVEGRYVLAAEPVHDCGFWSIQSVKLFRWMPRVPCYFTFSYNLFGKKLYFNIGCKPDMTYDGPGTDKNWHFGWPEMSLTWG